MMHANHPDERKFAEGKAGNRAGRALGRLLPHGDLSSEGTIGGSFCSCTEPPRALALRVERTKGSSWNCRRTYMRKLMTTAGLAVALLAGPAFAASDAQTSTTGADAARTGSAAAPGSATGG